MIDTVSNQTKRRSSGKFNGRVCFVALQAVGYHIPFIQLSASSCIDLVSFIEEGHMNLLNHRVFSLIFQSVRRLELSIFAL